MQPATFNDGESLASTHYLVDACCWKGETFIDGTTFLLPSKLPEAGLECYSVHLDDTTGVHHVARGKTSPQKRMPLTEMLNVDFSSHTSEFANGKMTKAPRVICAATSVKRKTLKAPFKGHQWDSSIGHPKPVRDIVRRIQFGMIGQDNEVNVVEPIRVQPAGNQSILADSSLATPHGVDSSITGLGRVIGQQAADDQSTLSNFSLSILHILPGNATSSTAIKGFDVTAQAQEPVANAAAVQTPENSMASRRSSAASQGSGIPTSTAPTSPGFSTFSTLKFWKTALANLPNVPDVPGKPTYTLEALALEEPRHYDLEEYDDPENTLLRRLAWDLKISHRQLHNWDVIQAGKYVPPKDMSASGSDLTIPEEVQMTPLETSPSSKVLTSDPAMCDKTPGVLPPELVGKPGMPSHDLDITPGSKEKQTATKRTLDNEDYFEKSKGNGHDAAENPSTGVSEIPLQVGESRNSAETLGSPNIGEMIETFFGDDKDDFTTTTPIVNVVQALPVVNIPPVNSKILSLKDTAASVPFGLGSPIPIHAINAINTEFFRLWYEGVSGRCWIPGQDEDEVQRLATVNVAPLYDDLPQDIMLVAKDFNTIVAELWEQGHPRRPLLGGRDDDLVFKLAACNLAWSYFRTRLENNVKRPTEDRLTVQPRKILGAAPSSSEWFLQALGRDDQYSEHRSVETAKVERDSKSKHSSRDDTCFHHLNFNYDAVYERNYTPAEVSFWAASTTINKTLVSCAEHCLVHQVKVVTSQAFKKVDPVIYTGTNIEALRELTGSAMRNAATSDVEVAYEAVGTWNQDVLTLEDVEPRVVSVNDGDHYEHSQSGLYNFLQRPLYINDEHDEHKLCNFNGPEGLNPSMSRVRLGYEQKFSNLGPSQGVKPPANRAYMRYSGRCSSWDSPAQKTTTVPEAMSDGATVSDLSAGSASEIAASEAITSTEHVLDDARAHVLVEDVEEPAHEDPASANMSEEALEQSQNSSVANEEVGLERESIELAGTDEGLVPREIEEPVEQLEEPEVDMPLLSEYPTDDERSEPQEPSTINDLARSSNRTHRLSSKIPQATTSSPWPQTTLKSKHCQKREIRRAGSSHFVNTNTRQKLASWSSSPGRVLRGESGHAHPISSPEQHHPDLDWESMEITPDSVEQFSIVQAEAQTTVDPDFDEYITDLLGPNPLAQSMMSGQGIPRTSTSDMLAPLGHDAVPQIQSVPNAKDDITSQTHPPIPNQPPTPSGRALSPTKMLSSTIHEPQTPAGSPSTMEDFGVWEDDGEGGFETPGKRPRPRYIAGTVQGQGAHFTTDGEIFDSSATVARTAFHEALVSADARSSARAARLRSVWPTTGILSPVQETSRMAIATHIRHPSSLSSSTNTNTNTNTTTEPHTRNTSLSLPFPPPEAAPSTPQPNSSYSTSHYLLAVAGVAAWLWPYVW